MPPKLTFARLEGCTDSICRALRIARSYANTTGVAIALSVVISTIFYVANDTLDVLFSIALTVVLKLVFFHFLTVLSRIRF